MRFLPIPAAVFLLLSLLSGESAEPPERVLIRVDAKHASLAPTATSARRSCAFRWSDASCLSLATSGSAWISAPVR